MLDSSANLKFINNRPVKYGSGVISRSSIATWKDESGLLKTAQPNEARPWFIDGEWSGIVIEQSASQTLEDNIDFSTGWLGSIVSGLVSGQPSPDGGTSGFLATSTAIGSEIYKTIAADSETRTASFFVSPVTATSFTLTYGDAESVFDLVEMSATGTGIIETYGDFFRLSVTGSAPSGGRIELEIGTDQPVGSSAIIAFANLATGNISSYIPGVMTRDADNYIAGVTDSRLVCTNVPVVDTTAPNEESAVLWSDSDEYADRAIVVYEGNLYSSNQDNNADRPDEGERKEPKTWTLIGPSNRWKCLDMYTGVDDPTVRPDYIEYIFMVGQLADSIAFHGVDASELKIQVFNSGAVSEFDQDLVSTFGIDDFWSWFYRDRIPLNQTTQNILAPAGSMIRVVLRGDSGSIKLGKVVFGTMETIGVTLEALPIENSDFSVVTRNDWGKAYIRQGRTVDLKKYSCKIESQRTAYLNETLKKLGRTSTSWIGLDGVDATILFGFKESANFEYYHAKQESDCFITVIGL